MTPRVAGTAPVPPSPKGWIDGRARQGSLGGTRRKAIRIKESS